MLREARTDGSVAATNDSARPRSSGEMAAAISKAAVRLIAEYTGRGPTRAHTTITPRWVFITLEDTLTKGERQLAANGKADWVLQTRKHFQSVMRRDLENVVREHTGREVLAFMSDNHTDPDVAVEAFLMAPNGGVFATDETASP